MTMTTIAPQNGASAQIASSQPAPRGAAAPVIITEEHRTILRGMIDRNATNAQIEMLIVVGNRYNLDPLMGHVVLINGKCFVTHKGLMHVAHTSGAFDGIEIGYGRDDQGDYCECSVFRKDMSRPFNGRIYIDEYRAAGPVWKQYPRAMAAKTAESFVLRRAFDVALTSQEEMGVDAPPLPPPPSNNSLSNNSLPDARVTRDGTPRAERTPPQDRSARHPERPTEKAPMEKPATLPEHPRDTVIAMLAEMPLDQRVAWRERFEQKWGSPNPKALSEVNAEVARDAIYYKEWPFEAEFKAAMAAQAAASEPDPFADDADQPELLAVASVAPVLAGKGHGDS